MIVFYFITAILYEISSIQSYVHLRNEYNIPLLGDSTKFYRSALMAVFTPPRDGIRRVTFAYLSSSIVVYIYEGCACEVSGCIDFDRVQYGLFSQYQDFYYCFKLPDFNKYVRFAAGSTSFIPTQIASALSLSMRLDYKS